MGVILETERLLLREFVIEDVPAFFRLVSDPDVTRYTGDGANTIEEARAGLEARVFADYQKYGYGRCAAVYKPTGAVIGFAGLKYLDDLGEVDLGYRFFKEYWGQGLATEAAAALVRDGFDRLRLPKLIGIADVENTASIRVLEKVGFQYVRRGPYRGHDVVWYVLENKTPT